MSIPSTSPLFGVVSLVAALLSASGCTGRPVAGANAATGGSMPVQAAHGAPKPLVSHGAEPSVETVTGKVLETIDAGSYTYVRVDTGSGEVWAAANRFEVRPGDRVVVPLEMPMRNFHSQSLDRDFPLVYFASQIAKEGERPMGSRASAVGGTQAAEGLAAPEGGTTVEAVWANRQALAGRTVTVRGKVVKFNGGILERHWLHLQDGTGRSQDRTHDLTVTMPMTTAPPGVGDIVTVSGTLAVDQDFGAGYTYAAILENAKIVAK